MIGHEFDENLRDPSQKIIFGQISYFRLQRGEVLMILAWGVYKRLQLNSFGFRFCPLLLNENLKILSWGILDLSAKIIITIENMSFGQI